MTAGRPFRHVSLLELPNWLTVGGLQSVGQLIAASIPVTPSQSISSSPSKRQTKHLHGQPDELLQPPTQAASRLQQPHHTARQARHRHYLHPPPPDVTTSKQKIRRTFPRLKKKTRLIASRLRCSRTICCTINPSPHQDLSQEYKNDGEGGVTWGTGREIHYPPLGIARLGGNPLQHDCRGIL